MKEFDIQTAALTVEIAADALKYAMMRIGEAETMLKAHAANISERSTDEDDIVLLSFYHQIVETRENLGLVFATIPGPDLLADLREFTPAPTALALVPANHFNTLEAVA